MHLDFKNLLLDSTLCRNSLEFLVFSSRKMLWQLVIMVLKNYTRHFFFNSTFFSSYECLLSKATGNSDCQRGYKVAPSTRGIEVRM